MAPTIDLAFIEEYNSQVHLLYRQYGSRLQNMTRAGTVQGEHVRFQRFGHLSAYQKTRNAIHTFQDPEHSNVRATMADYYVPTLIDKLDLLKLNIDERNAHARAQVAALGQQVDAIILTAMTTGMTTIEPAAGPTAPDEVGDAAAAWTYDNFMSVVTQFQVREVPDDGRRFCALHPFAWAQALQVPEFANADYVGPAQLPFAGGMTGKSWMGVMWFALPNISHAADVASNIAWHQDAVGHGVNSDIETNWDWENDRSAWSCVSMMSCGSTVIDIDGVMAVSSLSASP
jgi:hypothetical protein